MDAQPPSGQVIGAANQASDSGGAAAAFANVKGQTRGGDRRRGGAEDREACPSRRPGAPKAAKRRPRELGAPLPCTRRGRHPLLRLGGLLARPRARKPTKAV